MNELDTLRPEVQKALDDLSYFLTGTHNHDDFYIIRAELVRLAMIEADALIALDCEHDWQVEHERAEKAEAELAALKARIERAPFVEVWGVQGVAGLEPSYTVRETPAVVVTPLLAGKIVRLVVAE